MKAVRALLAGVVDYAGLFPPASLDMQTAVRNYASYRADDAAWMLGRFVVPVVRLAELHAALRAIRSTDAPQCRVAALLGERADADIREASAWNDAVGELAIIDTIEGKFSTADAIHAAAAAAGSDFDLFAEVPLDPAPEALVAAIKRAGVNAKMRTGGVTPEALPAPESVVRFIRRCLEADVRFKATAGLHHPITAERALTYEPDGPHAVMFGYLNVFLAAGFMSRGMNDADAIRLLGETRVAAIEIGPDAIAWEGHRLSDAELRQARDRVIASFGSCSFREPVDELRQLTVAA